MKFTKRLGAGIVAAAMATAVAMPAMAFAATDANDAVSELDKAFLTKVIKADQELGVYTSADTYSFTFTPVNDSAESAVPATAFSQITKSIPALNAAYDDSTQSAIQQLSLDNIFNANDYSRAGVYNYIVEESAPTTAIDNTSVSMTGAVDKYLAKVYVINDGNGGLKIEGIGIYKDPTIDTETITTETKIVTPGEHKADPTETVEKVKEDVTTVNGDGEGEYSGFVFENTYTNESGVLDVTKVVTSTNSNDHADRSLEWAFTTTLTLPANYTAAQAQTVAANIAGAAEGVTATANGKVITATFKLDGGKSATDNDAIKLQKLPIGTDFAVVEDVAKSMPAGWTQKSHKGDTGTTVIAGNAATITNEFDDASVTPTGILINNLPYMLFVGIPVVALLAWFAMRRRNMGMED